MKGSVVPYCSKKNQRVPACNDRQAHLLIFIALALRLTAL